MNVKTKKMIETAYGIASLPALALVVCAIVIAVIYCALVVLIIPPFWSLGKEKIKAYFDSKKKEREAEEAEEKYLEEELKKARGE